MCGHTCKRKVQAPEPYTGETVDLARGPIQTIKRRFHFQWWMLWLIWPAVGLIKAVAASAVGIVTTLSQIAVPLLPFTMIVVGVLLIVAHYRDRS